MLNHRFELEYFNYRKFKIKDARKILFEMKELLI